MTSNKKKSNNRLHFDKFIVVLFAVLAVGLVGGGYIAGSQAARPSATPSSVTILNEGAKIGEYIKASATYPTNTKTPLIQFTCYQDGKTVWGVNVGPDEAKNTGVLLGGGWSPWLDKGGAANCEARLVDAYWRGGQQYVVQLAKTTFNVEE